MTSSQQKRCHGWDSGRQAEFPPRTTAASRLTVAQVKPIGEIRSLVVTLRDTAAESALVRKNQRFRFLRRSRPCTTRNEAVRDRRFLRANPRRPREFPRRVAN